METKSSVYPLAMTAVMAAVIAAISPFAIPVGPISITLCTLALYFSPYVLGWKRAALATLVYILLGMVGVPVFSKFQAGLGVLIGPTGGYILGYIPMVAVGGVNETNFRRFLELGCAGVGIGGNLARPKLVAEGRFDELTALARRFSAGTQ